MTHQEWMDAKFWEAVSETITCPVGLPETTKKAVVDDCLRRKDDYT